MTAKSDADAQQTCDRFSASPFSLNWSPDGRFLLMRSANTLYLYDQNAMNNPAQVFEENTAEANNIFSEDSRYLLTRNFLYDLTTNEIVREITEGYGLTQQFRITPDGNYIYNTIGVWEALSGDLILDSFGGANFNFDLNYAYAEEEDRGNLLLTVVDLNDPERRSHTTISGISGQYFARTAFSTTGDRAVMQHYETEPGIAYLLNPFTGERIGLLDQTYPRLTGAIFSPSGRTLVTKSTSSLPVPSTEFRSGWRLWDSESGVLLRVEDESEFIAYTPDDGIIYATTVNRNQYTGLYLLRNDVVTDFSAIADLPAVISGINLLNNEWLIVRGGNRLFVWSIGAIAEDQPPESELILPSSAISTQINSDGTRLLSVHEQSYLATPVPPAPRAYLWDVTTGAQLAVFDPFPNADVATPDANAINEAQSVRYIRFIEDSLVVFNPSVDQLTYFYAENGQPIPALNGASAIQRNPADSRLAFRTETGVFTYDLDSGVVTAIDTCE